jgi:diaminohydroxyphosphoribosylaminopyrimidine deaminase/5-amino-6-(5-phosphoribosylamino)uracil reductase
VTKTAATPADIRFMDTALAHAYAALGSTAPNPAVGCVLVKHGRVLASAATAPGGRPHAETQALDLAGDAARGAVAYVSLEPCAHHGQTPPCAEALIASGVAEVVIACRDPFESVNGRGIEILERAGIRVRVGVRETEAQRLNAGFFQRVRTGRPIAEADTRDALYEARLEVADGEDIEAALERLGASGVNRVRLASKDARYTAR